MAFFVLPIVAIFTHTGLGTLIHQLSNPVVRDALVVTLKSTLLAQAFIIGFGTPTAYFLATHRFPGHALLVSLVELPIVLPPAVAGIGLLVAFGRFGLLGSDLSFQPAGGDPRRDARRGPVLRPPGDHRVRGGRSRTSQAASRTLGASPLRTFFRVTFPLALGGLIAGTAFSVARGLGEFGATIMFAGSLQGRTQTLTLAIYGEFDRVDGLEIALSISALLVIVSLSLLLSLKLVLAWQPSHLTSLSLFDRSR